MDSKIQPNEENPIKNPCFVKIAFYLLCSTMYFTLFFVLNTNYVLADNIAYRELDEYQDFDNNKSSCPNIPSYMFFSALANCIPFAIFFCCVGGCFYAASDGNLEIVTGETQEEKENSLKLGFLSSLLLGPSLMYALYFNYRCSELLYEFDNTCNNYTYSLTVHREYTRLHFFDNLGTHNYILSMGDRIINDKLFFTIGDGRTYKEKFSYKSFHQDLNKHFGMHMIDDSSTDVDGNFHYMAPDIQFKYRNENFTAIFCSNEPEEALKNVKLALPLIYHYHDCNKCLGNCFGNGLCKYDCRHGSSYCTAFYFEE